MQKRRPGGSGADLLAGDRLDSTKPAHPRPPVDELAAYRALRLVQQFAVRPELAAMLSGLAFGGAR